MKNYITLRGENGWTIKIDLSELQSEYIGSLVDEILDVAPNRGFNWQAFEVGDRLWFADGSMNVVCSKKDIRKNVIEFR